MNTRSLRFQLVVWYAGLLTSVLLLLGIITYFGLERYLKGTLKDGQERRARQISATLIENTNHVDREHLRREIEVRYAPSQNTRFVRVSRKNGAVLYESEAPKGGAFQTVSIQRPVWHGKSEALRIEVQASGAELLVIRHVAMAMDGTEYIVETGAPMDAMRAGLRQWLLFLVVGLPVLLTLALAGGYFLVGHALGHVDQITATAERISSQNLSERLPVAKTGDELERLTIALNHMITRLDDAFQYSRRFVADASHELRTPLTVLRGELEAVLRETDQQLTPEQRETIADLLEEVERLSSIVEGLFALSRLDAGEGQREAIPFDLGELTTSTADQMALLATDKGIELKCRTNGAVRVDGDRSRLKQVVVNLLDNAIKYTANGGAISLSVGAGDGSAVLEVKDNGIGIPPEAIPHVFERFFRVDKARSRVQGGAGLGLSIVRSIVAAHNGRVSVVSAPEHGSCFRVELPLSQKLS